MTQKNKHTPAPWTITKVIEPYSKGYDNDNWGFELKLGSHYKAVTVWSETEQEARANTNLIAAAPELLEALEKVDDVLSTLDQDKFGACRLIINIAINKAKGE